jgi:hypothetical protein
VEESSSTTATVGEPDGTSKRPARRAATAKNAPSPWNGSDDYVLPLIHAHVRSEVVTFGFFGALAGAVTLGAIDPPLGVLVAAGVVVAHHQRSH